MKVQVHPAYFRFLALEGLEPVLSLPDDSEFWDALRVFRNHFIGLQREAMRLSATMKFVTPIYLSSVPANESLEILVGILEREAPTWIEAYEGM